MTLRDALQNLFPLTSPREESVQSVSVPCRHRIQTGAIARCPFVAAGTETGMCGILGIVAERAKSVSLSDTAVVAMRDRMTARGPDDAGLFRHRNIAFAHRRLAIRDLSAGQQPWISNDGQCVLVYNGELYNDAELRAELESLGHRFRTHCDTEVLMAAYREWGRECVSRLRGMFAFGVYDFRDDSLLLVRDRFGIKPLFLADIDGCLVFASSIAAILKHPRFTKRPHLPAISHYLTTFRLTLDRATVYEGIWQLQPGELLEWKGGRVSVDTYWRYPEVDETATDYPSAVSQLRETLADAVRRRLISDVPVGLFLSGGVDSSTIACLVRESTSQPMIARCGGGDEDVAGDFAFARQCALFAGFDFEDVRLPPDDYFTVWQRLLDDYETPVSTPTDVVLFRLAEEMKLRAGVVLGGEGADELLCGYAVQHWSGHDFDRAQQLPFAGSATQAAAQFRHSLQQQYGRDRFQSRADHFFALNSLIPIAAKPALFQPAAWDAAQHDEGLRESYGSQLDHNHEEPTANRYTKLLHRVNLEGLLSRLDSATMAAGLEARVPYTDHHLVEAMFRLPLRYKIDTAHVGPRPPYCSAFLDQRGEIQSKRLLRSVAEQLMPSDLAHRKKASFPTPVSRWLTENWSQPVRETLTHSRFGREWFRPAALSELAENLPAAGMWLWPLLNVIQWGERQFA